MNLIQIVNTTLNSAKRFFIKNQPKIFMVGGISLSAAGTITACAATYKHIDRILDTTREDLEESETGKEKVKAVAKCAGEIAKVYALPVALTAAGYGGIIYAIICMK